jgi:hypothetical protein
MSPRGIPVGVRVVQVHAATPHDAAVTVAFIATVKASRIHDS